MKPLSLLIMAVVAIALFSAFALAGKRSLQPKAVVSHTNGRTPCTVLFIYDGDTLACDINQNGRLDAPSDKIRMIGIDAPEMSYSRKNHSGQDQPFAKAAKNFLVGYQHKTVYLRFDIKRSDRYERTLAYIYPSATSKVSLNETLLAQGLAKVLFLPPNTVQEGPFIATALSARRARRGLWNLP
jgi:micrococcal nuclease